MKKNNQLEAQFFESKINDIVELYIHLMATIFESGINYDVRQS